MYSVQETVTSPTEFGGFAGVVETWLGKRTPGAFPRWRDYDIPDFRHWIGYVSLARVIGPPFDLRYEYYGTGLCHLAARDMTGYRLSDSFPAEAADQHRRTADYLECLWLEKSCGMRRITFDIRGREWIEASIIDLIVGKTTPEPSHILSYLHVDRRAKARPPVRLAWQTAAAQPRLMAGE